MVEEKQVFIFTYLQDLHLNLTTILRLTIPGIQFLKDIEYDGTKFYRIWEDPLKYQQCIMKLYCDCNRNFTISRAYINLQLYHPICLKYKDEDLILTLELLLDYGLIH